MRNWILIASDFEQFLKEKHLSREYGDLIFFHLLIGAMYLAKEEMTYQGKKNSCRGEDIKAIQQKPVCRTKTDTKRVHSLYKAD
mgnify:CR=1 FL=1